MKALFTLALVWFALLTVGCQEQGEPTLLPPADVGVWEASVQPYVERRCGTLDCHGVPGRPMRLYSEQGLRESGRDRSELLSREELEANVASAVGVDPDASPERHLLLLSPLAVDAGGIHHVGGDIFASPADPGYRCLALFLRGEDPTSSCNEALSRLP